jgi:hypothetical protein
MKVLISVCWQKKLIKKNRNIQNENNKCESRADWSYPCEDVRLKRGISVGYTK